MQPPRILVFAGSTAPDSPASLLSAAFMRELAFLDAEPTRIALADYPLPLFDADASSAQPPNALRLRELVRSHHAVFVVSPSRSGSMPPLLHNLLEWLGPREEPRRGPPPLFAAAAIADDDWSAGAALAGLSGHLTRGLGATLVGGGLAVGRGGCAFDSKGGLDDPRLAAALTRFARDLVAASRERTNNP